MTNTFDAKASAWDEQTRRVQMACAIGQAIINAVPLKKTMRALEVGCGTGLVTTCLAPRLASVVAVDTSSGMLEVLRDKIEKAAIDNIVPMQADLAGGHSITDTIDLVFSSMAFHHIPDYKTMLGVLHGLLKPGGWLAIADLDAEDGSFHDPEAQYEYRGFDRDEFRAALRHCGFTAIGDSTAYVITRPERDDRSYPLFLVTGQKGHC